MKQLHVLAFAILVALSGAALAQDGAASAPSQPAAVPSTALRAPLDERVVIDMPPRWTLAQTKRGNLPGAEWWWAGFADAQGHANIYVRVERGTFTAPLAQWEEQLTDMLLKTWWKEGHFRKIGAKDATLGSGQAVRFTMHGIELGPRLTQEFAILVTGDEQTRVLVEVYPSSRHGDITRDRGKYEALHTAAKAISFTPGK